MTGGDGGRGWMIALLSSRWRRRAWPVAADGGEAEAGLRHPSRSPRGPAGVLRIAAGLFRCCFARVFKRTSSVERHLCRLDGTNRLGQRIEGIGFRAGVAARDAE